MNFPSNSPAPTGRRGLTVVEGVLLVAILGFMVYFVLPQLIHRHHHYSPRTDCRSNLRQIGLALELYLSDHGHHKQYPPGGDLMLLNGLLTLGRRPILRDQFGLLVCAVKETAPPLAAPILTHQTDYILKAGGSATESAILASFADNEPIGIDKPGNHRWEDGTEESANILFFDTHVETVTNPSKISDYRRRIVTPGPTTGANGSEGNR